jgi:NADH-quinone oxidoreductase subunit E
MFNQDEGRLLMTAVDEELTRIFQNYPDGGRDSLIPIMQEVQDTKGYISRDSVVAIGQYLKLPSSKIYGVATFYNQFRFQAIGKYHIQVCRGTACHVKGSGALLEVIKQELKIQDGETTRDGLFSIEVVACIGACGLAPVIAVNGEFHAKLTQEDARKLLKKIRKQEEAGK